MNERVDWKYLLSEARARVYLLWAALSFIGFTAAHLSKSPNNINFFWLFLSIIGLGYMYKVMPMRMKSAKQVFLAWLVPIAFGSTVSILVFRVGALADLIPYLGGFWLLIMAVGYFLNGLVDAPSTWYWIAVGVNAVFGLACIFVEVMLPVQFLVAGIVSVWSMLNLWIFRSEAL